LSKLFSKCDVRYRGIAHLIVIVEYLRAILDVAFDSIVDMDKELEKVD
jgi:hypothetical protein